MAANNFFGFAAASPYGGQPTVAAYQAGVAYAATPAAYATATLAQPRVVTATYDAYQATPAVAVAGAYYTPVSRHDPLQSANQAYRETYTFSTPTAAAATFGAGAAYAAALPAAPVIAYTAADSSAFHTKPLQIATTYQQRPKTTSAQKTGTTYQTSSAVYTPTVAVTYVTTAAAPLSGYDAAIYSAATSLIQQQQAKKTTAPSAIWQYKKNIPMIRKPKQPPRTQQLHYCDVCKISCAGPQTYKEHLDGQKHKKKEAAAKLTKPKGNPRGQKSLRCELCDVTCTGNDAYTAHIRGAKHVKVVKLHTRLGKPIPSSEPVVVSSTSSATVVAQGTSTTTNSKAIPTVTKVVATPRITFVSGTKAVRGVPAVSFVPGSKLNTTSKVTETEVKTESAAVVNLPESKDDSVDFDSEKEIIPVGEEYIEEVRNEEGKVVSFTCKLCECRFNDPNAKEMHMKGRRHRLQYKKKVNPDLEVEIKPSLWQRRQQEKLQRQLQKEEFWRRRNAQMRYEAEQRHIADMEARNWAAFRQNESMQRAHQLPHRPPSYDDRHTMAKHATIYPNETELKSVQAIVTAAERALKLVAEDLAIESQSVKQEDKQGWNRNPEETSSGTNEKILKGVMRVGALAKGLVLHGYLDVDLVLMCSTKPTLALLNKVADCLPKHIATVTDDKYVIGRHDKEAAIILTSTAEPKTSVKITLTSPLMRETIPEGELVKDPPDVLDRQKCLDALAALRHAKWFQAKASGLQSCVIVLRVMMDLCNRVPTWSPLKQWAMELLCTRCIESCESPLGPGDCLRRTFEAIASGILLPGGPGIIDPCEKDPADAAESLTKQNREDITASAQMALRLMTFRQIHKVLGMEPLQPLACLNSTNPRKRRFDSTDQPVAELAETKKDKKLAGIGADLVPD